MEHNKYTVPEPLSSRLRDLGLISDFPFLVWQEVTDFLRERFHTHIIIYPQETMTPPFYVFDYTIVSPYGASWETEKQFVDYYQALEDAITQSIHGINEAHGTDTKPGYGNLRPGEVPPAEEGLQESQIG